MPNQDFLAFKRAAELATEFREGSGERPGWATASVEQLIARFDGPTPESGEEAVAVIDALASAAEGGLMGMTGPDFYGWVIGGSHPAGVAADWLTSAWGQNSANYHGAPANAVAEDVAAKWLLDILDLPRDASVGYTTGATMANLIGLAAARSEVLRRAGWDVEADGMTGAPEVAVLIGEDAHTTVYAGLRVLGFGTAKPIRVASDSEGRMLADALEIALKPLTGPKIVIAQAGQINTGAFDPFEDIAKLCEQAGAWLHVDGAFGIWARSSPMHKGLTAGLERADSWGVDGHKWLQLPYDNAFVIVRNRDAHQRAMAITASYLPVNTGEERNPSLYVTELSRRARGFATWTIMKTLGRQGISDMVARHCGLARRLKERLSAEPGIDVLNDVVLNQLAVGFGANEELKRQDELSRAVIDALQKEKRFVAGGAEWHGRWIMRVSIISWETQAEHIDAFADAIIRNWRQVRGATE